MGIQVQKRKPFKWQAFATAVGFANVFAIQIILSGSRFLVTRVPGGSSGTFIREIGRVRLYATITRLVGV